MSALEGATCGAIGAVVALSCTFPLATAKTRLQAQRKRRAVAQGRGERDRGPSSFAFSSEVSAYTGTADCIARVIREEGLAKLYAGMAPALSKAAGTNFVFYYFFSLLGNLYFQRGGGTSPSLLKSMLHGMAAGACVQMVMLPTDLVVTRLMASGSSAGYFETLWSIVENNGVLSLWDGIGPGLSLTLNPGITTLIRNKLTDLAGIVDGGSASAHFWIGLVSKACASSLTYPYTLVKVQMQIEGMRRSEANGKKQHAWAPTRSGVEGDGDGVDEITPTPLSMWGMFAALVRESGVGGLYRGLFPQLLNAMLKEALLNMVRLKIAVLVARIFKAGRRLLMSMSLRI